LRWRLGEAARRHVLERYGIEVSARKYLDVYRELRPSLAAGTPTSQTTGRIG
jgi:hypothetical protein